MDYSVVRTIKEGILLMLAKKCHGKEVTSKLDHADPMANCHKMKDLHELMRT